MKFKILLVSLSVISAFSATAFASAQNEADYQCGQYTLDLRGPDQTSLYDSKGNLLAHWDKEGTDPTFIQNGKVYLVWGNQPIECKLIAGG